MTPKKKMKFFSSLYVGLFLLVFCFAFITNKPFLNFAFVTLIPLGLLLLLFFCWKWKIFPGRSYTSFYTKEEHPKEFFLAMTFLTILTVLFTSLYIFFFIEYKGFYVPT